MTTLERRHSERARIPCNIPVELTDTSRSAQFEADAVDLSVGGLSLRSTQLPDVGSQLFCSFEAMPGGAQVLGRGEVVWRQPSAGMGGEFGLRFIEVDPKNQALIDEMVAERIARIETPFAEPAPVLANLEIENVAAPVPARLVQTNESEALFEQSLDQFTVGKSVVAHAGVSLVRGHISAVKLRMEGTTPQLVLTLALPRDPARFGEFEWGEPGSDTDPDVFNYAGEQDDDDLTDPHAETSEDDELEEEDQDSDEEDEVEDESDEEVFAAAADDDSLPLTEADVEVEEDLPAFRRERSRTLSGLGAHVAAGVARARETMPQLPLFKREGLRGKPTLVEGAPLQLSLEDAPRVRPDENTIFELLSTHSSGDTIAAPPVVGGDPVSEPDENDPSLPVLEEPPNTFIMRVLRVLARVVEVYNVARDRVRELLDRARPGGAAGASTGPRAARSWFAPRPRRVTAVANRESNPNQNKLRWVVIGSVFCLALVLVAYALLPSGGEYPQHRNVGQEQAQDDAARGDQVAAGPVGNPAAQTNGRTGDTSVSAATSPSAAAAKANIATATQFGQGQLRNPRRFTLRMSDPVKLLQGTADAGGFSVAIPNNHATERAAPIKAGHPAVAKAAIINRRDRSAELIVRFVDGQSPAYRVTGLDSGLEILIDQ